METIRVTLLAIGGTDLVTSLHRGCFGWFLGWNPGQKSQMALHHVISRQLLTPAGRDDGALHFYLRGQVVSFTISDWALLTGLEFGESEFDTTATYDVSALPAVRAFCGGDAELRVSALLTTFQTQAVEDPSGELYLQVAHILALYYIFLGVDPKRRVQSWVWQLVSDMSTFSQYPWGAYTWLTFRHYISMVPDSLRYHVYGPSWALLVWAFEMIPTLADAAGIREVGDPLPRCLRWRFQSRLTVDLAPIFEWQVISLVSQI
jgi:hypothetical protein